MTRSFNSLAAFGRSAHVTAVGWKKTVPLKVVRWRCKEVAA